MRIAVSIHAIQCHALVLYAATGPPTAHNFMCTTFNDNHDGSVCI